MITFIKDLSQREFIAIAWFAYEEDKKVDIPNAEIVKDIEGGCQEPTYWKFYDSMENAINEVQLIWNNFSGVRIYPCKNKYDVYQIIEWDFNDRSDEKRLGMDYGNRWYYKIGFSSLTMDSK